MWRYKRAQASVEFALAATTFLLVILGALDVARGYIAYTVIASCAREAARSGAAHLGQAGWDLNAIQAGFNLAVGVDTSQVTIHISQQTIDSSLQPYVRADVTYPFHSVVPLVGALLGDPVQMNASAVVLAG
jgi:Flp pilus assembly protein TadG